MKISLPNRKPIELHKKSIEYLNDVFDKYTKVDTLPEVINEKICIHMYPNKDTFNSIGETTGYRDALHCDVFVYLTKSKVYKQISCYADQIEIEKNCAIRIFSDGATIIIINPPTEIDIFQSISIY